MNFLIIAKFTESSKELWAVAESSTISASKTIRF